MECCSAIKKKWLLIQATTWQISKTLCWAREARIIYSMIQFIRNSRTWKLIYSSLPGATWWWWWGLTSKRQEKTFVFVNESLSLVWWLRALYICHYVIHKLYINRVDFVKNRGNRKTDWIICAQSWDSQLIGLPWDYRSSAGFYTGNFFSARMESFSLLCQIFPISPSSL